MGGLSLVRSALLKNILPYRKITGLDVCCIKARFMSDDFVEHIIDYMIDQKLT